MFDFSNENVGGNTSGDIVIFNGGVAGKVSNVKITVEKKGIDYPDEEGKKLPDYRVVYEDENGGQTNRGFYYLDEKTHNSQYRTFEEEVKRQWRTLAHIVEEAGGDGGIKTNTPVEMLDTMAKMVKQLVNGKTFNIFANYGHVNNPKKYIQVRSWVPFVEPTDVADTKLKATNIDQIERLVPDAEPSSEDDAWV